MKISEVISKLQYELATEGDIEVKMIFKDRLCYDIESIFFDQGWIHIESKDNSVLDLHSWE